MKVALPLRKPSLSGRPKIPKITKPSRKQFFLLLAALLLATFVGYNGYQRLFAPSAAAPSIQAVPARIGPLVSTLSATGSIVATRQAKLSFPSTGKLVELNVAVGDSVKAGQQLAKQDDSTLKLKVQTAETNLRVSQIKLQQLKDGATPEEKEAARASYESALARYNELIAGPTATEIQSAQASVEQAKANLLVAQVKLEQAKAGVSLNEQALLSGYEQAKASLLAAEDRLEKLKNPTASDLATAQAAVETARANLKNAQTALDELKNPSQSTLAAAQSAVNSAKQAMTSALDRYEMAKGDNLAASGFTSVTAAEQNYESAKANYETKLQDLNKLLNPSPEDLQDAQAKVDSAQASFDSAVAKLEQLKNPTAADLASAEAAVSEAKANLASAQSKLDQFRAGSSEADVQTAQASYEQAKAALATAEGKLAELLAGPKASEIQSAKSSLASAEYNLAQKINPPKELDLIQAEETVRQSEANLQQAKDDLLNATLVAPFDGIVASINANVGEQVSESTVMTIVDPKAIRIDVTVDESDVAKLAAGQPATITFDAAPDRQMKGKVLAVPPTGTTQQGVVTYLISIIPELDGPPLPAGMTAVASIEVERKESVLLVPNRSVRTVGRNKVVDVLLENGSTETRTVQVGSSNDQFTEIVSGLREGEMVVIPTTTIRSSMSPAPGGAVGGPPTKANVVIR